MLIAQARHGDRRRDELVELTGDSLGTANGVTGVLRVDRRQVVTP
jgi:hypothetical protein